MTWETSGILEKFQMTTMSKLLLFFSWFITFLLYYFKKSRFQVEKGNGEAPVIKGFWYPRDVCIMGRLPHVTDISFTLELYHPKANTNLYQSHEYTWKSKQISLLEDSEPNNKQTEIRIKKSNTQQHKDERLLNAW